MINKLTFSDQRISNRDIRIPKIEIPVKQKEVKTVKPKKFRDRISDWTTGHKWRDNILLIVTTVTMAFVWTKLSPNKTTPDWMANNKQAYSNDKSNRSDKFRTWVDFNTNMSKD